MRSLTAVHCVLAEICGNSFYEIMVNSLISISHEIILNTFEEGDAPLHGLGQHDQIVQAVLSKDPGKAAQAMKDHLIKFAEALVELDSKYRQKLFVG
jgi:DNA-binding FadR family transcriptional regulator